MSQSRRVLVARLQPPLFDHLSTTASRPFPTTLLSISVERHASPVTIANFLAIIRYYTARLRFPLTAAHHQAPSRGLRSW
ncbi:hypothetical protein SESBI_10303 [Sesbania bispinosa]|nr:hypothetical protein SESBI_10303 [Sesbania bispinosa]